MFKKRPLLKRRNVLVGLGTLSSTIIFGCTKRFNGDSQVKAQQNNIKSNFSVIGNATLRKRAAAKGIIYGAFPECDYKTLSQTQNKDLQITFGRECGLLANGLDFPAIHRSINSFDFTQNDSWMQFAQAHGMLVQGTSLVSSSGYPQWLQDKFNDPKTKWKEIQNILINNVSTVVKRYAGRIHSWNVVNEAISPDSGRSDALSRLPWLNKLGPDYIDLAFRVAADADPKALLTYNDGGLEYENPQHEARRTAVLKMLERLKSKGVPIHCLGIQGHLWGVHKTSFNPKKYRKFLTDVASLGLKIMITELDVEDHELPPDIDSRDRIIASIYEDYLSVALDERAVIAVITWGLSDRHTWLSHFSPRSDGTPVRPLPFDSDLKPKLAWNAIARAFDHAPKR